VTATPIDPTNSRRRNSRRPRPASLGAGIGSSHHAHEVGQLDLGSNAEPTPLYRYRVVTTTGTDLGPLVSRTAHWAIGEQIDSRDGPLELTAVVASETEGFRAYLVVKTAAEILPAG
jgi:hypothetical protein